MPHPFSCFYRLSRCRAKEICETFRCFTKSKQIISRNSKESSEKFYFQQNSKEKEKIPSRFVWIRQKNWGKQPRSSQNRQPSLFWKSLAGKHAGKVNQWTWESNFYSAGPHSHIPKKRKSKFLFDLTVNRATLEQIFSWMWWSDKKKWICILHDLNLLLIDFELKRKCWKFVGADTLTVDFFWLRSLMTTTDLLPQLANCYVHVALQGSQFDEEGN